MRRTCADRRFASRPGCQSERQRGSVSLSISTSNSRTAGRRKSISRGGAEGRRTAFEAVMVTASASFKTREQLPQRGFRGFNGYPGCNGLTKMASQSEHPAMLCWRRPRNTSSAGSERAQAMRLPSPFGFFWVRSLPLPEAVTFFPPRGRCGFRGVLRSSAPPREDAFQVSRRARG